MGAFTIVCLAGAVAFEPVHADIRSIREMHRMPDLPTNPAPSPSFDEQKPGPVVAWSITAALIILGLVMAASIYWRWLTVHEPSSAVLVTGDRSLDGAIITVVDRNDESKSWYSELSHYNLWQSPLLLDPGRYSISIVHRGREILHEDFQLPELHGFEERFTRHPLTGLQYDLPSLVTIVGDVSTADARIELVTNTPGSNFPPRPIVLTGAEDYRTAIYLTSGQYTILVRSNVNPGRVITQQAFDVDHTAPVQIDLTKAQERWRW